MAATYPSYIDGANFIQTEGEHEEWMFPREPDRYEPSDKFIQRFRKLGGAVKGDDIEDAIKYGESFTAARGCVAFVKNAGGVAFYMVVDAEYNGHEDIEPEALQDHYDELDADDFKHRAVTLWAYVYDRDRAWDTGRWTGDQLDTIEELEPEVSE